MNISEEVKKKIDLMVNVIVKEYWDSDEVAEQLARRCIEIGITLMQEEVERLKRENETLRDNASEYIREATNANHEMGNLLKDCEIYDKTIESQAKEISQLKEVLKDLCDNIPRDGYRLQTWDKADNLLNDKK